jgi:hypothetical protein
MDKDIERARRVGMVTKLAASIVLAVLIALAWLVVAGAPPGE